MKNGYKFGINEAEEYVAASTVKVPINMFLYTKISSGEIDLNETLEYMEADYEEGTGSIQGENMGTKYTLKELSSKSIIESDNIAVNMIIRRIGSSNYKNYMRKLGGKVVYEDKNKSSPEDMAIYLKELFDSYDKNELMGTTIVNSMENTIFNNRIAKLLPKDIKVAHKIGTQVGTSNDVGIVFTENPYIICVMSKNVKNEQQADEHIADISKKIYEHMININNINKKSISQNIYKSNKPAITSIFKFLRERFSFEGGLKVG